MISNVLGADDQTPHQVELNGKTYSWNGFYSLEVNAFGQEK